MTIGAEARGRYRARLAELGLGTQQRYAREAFSRNLGLISESEQLQLAASKVAIPGLGGVGGFHLVTLVRAGVGRFHLAEFDTFDPVNVNRQYGAKTPTFGRAKLDTMIEEALSINPYLDIRTFPEGINADNIDQFLEGVDVVVDGLDFFAFDTRRMMFRHAREQGIHVVSAGPIGFSTALLVFAPDRGMGFDEYFDVNDDTDEVDNIASFLVGLTPRTRYLSYMDLSRADRATGRGPSLGLACELCAGVAATETLRILLDRSPVKPAPHYAQFDPYLRRYFQGRLRWGNRHPWQRIKRRMVRRKFERSVTATATHREQAPPPVAGQAPPRAVAEHLVRAAIQAPSGDNSQPWRFRIAVDDRVEVYLDPEADRSFFNFRQLASIIACGAALENMRVVATACGRSAEIHYGTLAADDHHVATVTLAEASGPPDPLCDAVWLRHTNRTMYRRRPVPAGVRTALERCLEELPSARLHVLDQPNDLRRLAAVVRGADRLRTAHRGLHEHFHSMVRYSEREARERRDGFPLANLEAGFAGEQFLKLTRPWPVMRAFGRIGGSRVFAAVAARGLAHCSAAGLLTVSGSEPVDLLAGGQALQRVWLTLTSLGLAVQPMTAITLFWTRCQLEGEVSFSRSERRQLGDLWPRYRALFPAVDFDRDGHVMLFRFGHGRAIKVGTLRRPLEEVVVGGRERVD